MSSNKNQQIQFLCFVLEFEELEKMNSQEIVQSNQQKMYLYFCYWLLFGAEACVRRIRWIICVRVIEFSKLCPASELLTAPTSGYGAGFSTATVIYDDAANYWAAIGFPEKTIMSCLSSTILNF